MYADEPPRNQQAGRSTLPKLAARQRYVEMGELAALQQIREDSKILDAGSIPVGPFARLDAGAVAAQDGKTRGAITNLFGSQAAFQAETMALVAERRRLDREARVPGAVRLPDRGGVARRVLAGESARGPRHGSEPVVDYGFLWALWLSTVPYGLWSERVREPSMDEHVQLLRRLEGVIEEALIHFDLPCAPTRRSTTSRARSPA